MIQKKTMPHTRNSLPAETRTAVVELLNARLADLVVLGTHMKQAHWHVRGANFIGVHELLDRIAEDVRQYADLVAERAMQLGGVAIGTAGHAAHATVLPRYPTDIHESAAHIAASAEQLAAAGAGCRAAITTAGEHGDEVTADIFTEVTRGLDKWLWFIEAHES